jgi:hypothetical protein
MDGGREWQGGLSSAWDSRRTWHDMADMAQRDGPVRVYDGLLQSHSVILCKALSGQGWAQVGHKWSILDPFRPKAVGGDPWTLFKLLDENAQGVVSQEVRPDHA